MNFVVDVSQLYQPPNNEYRLIVQPLRTQPTHTHTLQLENSTD